MELLRGLEGVRVAELGQGVGSAYAAKLLGDLGADVMKIELPDGDPIRRRGPFRDGAFDPEGSGLFLHLNANKRAQVADLHTAEGRAAIDELVEGADVLIHDLAPVQLAELGGYDHFRAIAPHLVMCSITPWGLTGPRADWRAEEITVNHGGGWGWLGPGASPDPDLPPLKTFGHQAEFQAGLAASTATLAAVHRAQLTGMGEHIDLSVQAYVTSMLEAAFIFHTYNGDNPDRTGARALNPWHIFTCSDGLVFIVTPEDDQWHRLVELMGHPDWADLEIFADMPSRMDNHDALELFIEQWTTQHTVADIFHRAQASRIAAAPVQTMAQMAADPHLAERGFFVDVDHPKAGPLTHIGAPYRLTNPWWSIRRPAPTLDQNAGEGWAPREPVAGLGVAEPGDHPLPLSGIRVLDFTWVWAGPFATMHLAHLGAEVIKVESAARPDLGRRLPVYVPDLEVSLDSCGYFNQWGQGKKSIAVDLSTEEGLAAIRELVPLADVVIDNYATGVMERLGLGYNALRALRSDIVVATISGYGETGPYRTYMGYGPTTGPLSGLSSMTGYDDGHPQELGISLGDPAAGITAAHGIVAALVARDRTGEGQYVDVALWEATAVNAAEGWMDQAMNGTQPRPMGNHDPLMAPHDCYRCAGVDDWVTIACATDDEWRALAALIDPALVTDPRFATAADRKTNEGVLDTLVGSWTATLDRWAVTNALQAVGVAAFPSMSAADLAADEQLEAHGLFSRLDHPVVGVRTHTGTPWRLTNSPNGVRFPAPLLGQHTHEVLGDLLGYDDDRIGRIAASGLGETVDP